MLSIENILQRFGTLQTGNDDLVGNCVQFRYSSEWVMIDERRRHIFRHLWIAYGNNINRSDIIVQLCDTKRCMTKEHFKYVDVTSKSYHYERIINSSSQKTNGCIEGNGAPSVTGYLKWRVRKKVYRIHRVVVWCTSDQFHTMEDLPDLQVRHLCGNKKCVNHEHLKFGSPEEQHQDKVLHGTAPMGEDHHFATITEDKARQIINSWREANDPHYKSLEERAALYDVSTGIIRQIDSRRSWNFLDHPNGKSIPIRKETMKTRSDEEHFDYDGARKRLAKRSSIDVNNCWIWSTSIKNPYPKLCFEGRSFTGNILGAMIQERRFAPKGLKALHSCNVKHCVNPDHLRFGTSIENAQDLLRSGLSKNFKLNEHKVKEIRVSKQNTAKLALQYGVGTKTIQDVRNGKLWNCF